MDVSTPDSDTDRSRSRRTVLSAVGAVGLASIAGCTGTDGNGSGSAPDPITIDDQKVCDNCSMKIGNYRGPAGQSHYEDPTEIEGIDEERPAQFCSSLCTYTFTFGHEADPEVTYLTDYSSVEYGVDESGAQTTISRHLEGDAFGDVTELTMIAGSDVTGPMGDSIVPFSDAEQADDFQSDYGGDSYEHDEITQELVSSMMTGGM